MPYAEGRRFYDADAPPDGDARVAGVVRRARLRDRIPGFSLGGTAAAFVEKMIARGRSRASNPAERAAHEPS
jgi:hypothetical protein